MMKKRKEPRKSGNRKCIVAAAAAAGCILIPTSAYAVSGVSGLFEKAEKVGMEKTEFDMLYNNLSGAGYDDAQIADLLEPKTNESGQTYGAEWVQPDLIYAVGTNEERGYVKDEDLNKTFDTPEEAVAWTLSHTEPYTIPLYDSDGKTQIGEFLIDPSGR